MATITEDYVSFETAKLLKEKGFGIEEETRGYYPIKEDATGRLMFGAEYHHNTSQVQIAAPTLQMAMKWLREVHNLFIEIQCYGCGADEQSHFEFSFVIYEFVQYDNKSCITVGLEKKKAASQFRAYEETCETAIKYCLKNLI